MSLVRLFKKKNSLIRTQHNTGRYNKYSRTLSQTPWLIDGKRKTETSVEELIGLPLKEFFQAKEMSFMSSGREDVDVRMLGNGRPFVIELKSPKLVFMASRENMAKLQQKINEDARSQLTVKYLQCVSKEQTKVIKDGEEQKTKVYRALVWTSRPLTQADVGLLNNTKELVLDQDTPIRVLHRRSLSTRQRTVHKLRATPINDKYFFLDCLTQAGTYIKEFVHGDLGRTRPSIGTLLQCEADLAYLDVMMINLDFPPKIEDQSDDAIKKDEDLPTNQ
eukprot:TRINITY_DN225_c0_g1_i1.p1 TRINITY_DN225_c0_g1~~TRINITY_DN225_c0_g1_i1.p1  ORF type:complete len:277 (-),score=56.57 TRINITY_DN225_c0_g1_i1:27-857(-)